MRWSTRLPPMVALATPTVDRVRAWLTYQATSRAPTAKAEEMASKWSTSGVRLLLRSSTKLQMKQIRSVPKSMLSDLSFPPIAATKWPRHPSVSTLYTRETNRQRRSLHWWNRLAQVSMMTWTSKVTIWTRLSTWSTRSINLFWHPTRPWATSSNTWILSNSKSNS